MLGARTGFSPCAHRAYTRVYIDARAGARGGRPERERAQIGRPRRAGGRATFDCTVPDRRLLEMAGLALSPHGITLARSPSLDSVLARLPS